MSDGLHTRLALGKIDDILMAEQSVKPCKSEMFLRLQRFETEERV